MHSNGEASLSFEGTDTFRHSYCSPFVIADEIMHETELLAVAAMGMKMANMRLTTLNDVRHFKENISVLLISGIFVMLTASLDPKILIEIFNPPSLHMWRLYLLSFGRCQSGFLRLGRS